MELLQRVLSVLKTKAKDFGFDKAEMKSIAKNIADNLQLGEEATEEEIQTAVETAVDGALPMLKIVQSVSSRMAQKTRKKEDEDDDDDDDEPTKGGKSTKSEPDFVKTLQDAITALNAKIDGLTTERLTDSRKSKLEKLLKDTGTFGKSVMKNFSKMKFENDDEFDEFYSEVKTDLEELNQERIDQGLEKLGVAISQKETKKTPKIEEATDDEIDEIANQM